ncbi:hypothetical protein FPZ42_06195 [Mucilaginibacter achroorhodeus]|uniref:Uncharacterized protein n=1 Tax=Mucilaginibacter achroorhodeus TaxID=2599294 RepID=A0A563U5K5_9SPHI|nr:hypothetical protein [Mucilaginibacter achroorhodeus]TWR26627.1 hypothetical protein FPZ42_06195 [Mucilaginibacter achroorhodeus]
MISVARNDDRVDFPSGGKADQHPQTLRLPGSQEQGHSEGLAGYDKAPPQGNRQCALYTYQQSDPSVFSRIKDRSAFAV